MSAIPGGLAAALADRYWLERELGAGDMATIYPRQLLPGGARTDATAGRRYG
jgi:hypothetical protein